MKLLLDLLCLCLLCLTGKTLCDKIGPAVITVEGGTDVMLPCSLSTKEDIEFKLFDWRKVAQKDDGLKEVFLYDGGSHYNNGLYGQSEEFKGRVSHLQDELKHGNASIIIRNTKLSDSGVYTCYFPRLQPPQKFYIKLVVQPKVITMKEDSDVMLPCSLSTEENIESKFFDWKKVAQKDDGLKEVFLYDSGIHYNNGLDGQSEEFKGRVSHFQDELKHGNASIIIRNTKISDIGEYTCAFPRLQPPQTFYIELVVGSAPKPSITSLKETKDWRLLQCEVHGDPKPEVEWQDSDGNILNAEKPQVTIKRGLFSITLNTTVTKSDRYRCVATQEKISHQVSAETDVYIHGSGLSTGWNIALVLLLLLLLVAGVLAVLVYKGCITLNCNKESSTGWIIGLGLLLLLVAGVLAVLVYKGYITFNRNKGPEVIKVEEGSDVTLPCSLWPKDIQSTQFNWKKMSQNDESQMEVFLYDNGDLYSDERPGQSEQFKGRVSHFPDKLEQGNASIIIRNTTRADSGEYRCSFPFIQKPQEFYIKLDVVDGAAPKPSITSLKATKDWSLLHCEVHGNPEPEVKWQDSDGNKLPGEEPQVTIKRGLFYITLNANVTKSDRYRCVAKQETISHQISAETDVYIHGFSTGWIAAAVIGVLFLVVAGVTLAVLLYRRKRAPKVIKVEKGSDVTLPCSLWPKKDLRSTQFVWEKTDDGQKVFLYDNGDLYSDERPDQSEQFKGRVSHFPDELEQGNASIIIRNTTWADSGVYRCSFPSIQKPQIFHIKLVVEPKLITVEEGSDVTLPCSLWTKKDIRFTRFIWKKTDDGQRVFLYDNGDLYSDKLLGQSEQFKGRVSHFPDELKQGDASIIIRNTTRADSGQYRCYFPSIQKPQEFYIKLVVVGPEVIKVEEGSDVTLPCSLWNKDIRSTQFNWKKMSQNDESQMEVFLYDKSERPDQSEQFKGRVSHFPDELEQGNASIIIRNTRRADSGEYRCSFPLIQKHKKFHIKLVVEPKVITVEEGSDVTLPCSLITKENLQLTRFTWRKNYDGQMVFQYDYGVLYSDKRPGQSEQFKGRVSHFPDELEQGNASIIIRNTTRADSGEYRCYFPLIQKPQKFYIELVVGPKVIKVEEGSDVTLSYYLITKEDIRSTRFVWKKTDDDQKVFLYDNGHLYSDERPGQSEKFKGRVSHFPYELEQGNASIIIRNTRRADSGVYRCMFPFIQKPHKFYIKLDVVGSTPESDELDTLV
ncbi:uncharacterized protein LOC116034688 [Sander lucioperca]|uniref:uncharacterized protein LOC116034688 n=1 Tax=Sander lucioperca TaxID=283035 RepID=UPI001653474E|nr:uncharacterized protein LOC116034688 [Sander lucioperca]